MLSWFFQRSVLDRKGQLSYSGAMAGSKVLDPNCSIARSLGVLGERYTFLILREAMDGVTRFAQFRDALGIAPDVLTDRLTTLVEYGVMRRVPYQEPGSRSRYAYTLTPAGAELHVALGSLQQWGDAYLPRLAGPTIERRNAQDDPSRPRRFAPPPTPPIPDRRRFGESQSATSPVRRNPPTISRLPDVGGDSGVH
jgi:DNA-binding HxlR family transcriptional regulator